MTEEELAAIERQYEQDAPSIGYYPNIPTLIAEVRRLRELAINWHADYLAVAEDGPDSWGKDGPPDSGV